MSDTVVGGSLEAASKSSDWRAGYHSDSLTDFQKSILHADWEQSPLGPIRQWSAQLSQTVQLVLSDPSPAAVCWSTGTTNTIIGNEAYTSILDPSLAPAAARNLGLARDWCEMDDILQKQRRNGMTITMMPQRLVLLQRQTMLEEAYITWRFTPLRDGDGSFVGSHLTGVDVTPGTVATRRLRTISSLGRAIKTASNTTDLWSQILNGLGDNFNDIPMALLYSVNHSTSGPRALPAAERPRFSTQPLTCTLEGTIGDPAEHFEVPASFHLTHDESWLAPSFKKAIETGDLVCLELTDGTMPLNPLQDIHQQSQDCRPSRVVVCPLSSSGLGPVCAFLVLTLPSWRPYDNEYQSFVETLINQIGPSQIATVSINEKAQKHGNSVEQESSEQAKLALELQTRTLEVEEGEKKLARFTARAQVALGILDANGTVIFANPLWRDLTQLEPADTQVAWAKAIIPEDLEETYAIFARMLSESAPVDFHLRFNKRWQAPKVDRDGTPVFTDTHIICNLFPDLDEDGNVTTIMSCLTDISELKWVESQLRQRTADVEHREAMWRNFVDHAPTGLALLNPDGSLEFGNDTWWQMTQTPSSEKSGLAWVRQSIHAEDVSDVSQMFADSLDHDAPKTLEFRLKQLADRSHLAVPEPSNTVNITILCTVHTTFNPDRTVQHLVVWLTDITAQKLAEKDLRNRMDQAIHMKVQQEKFIAMTSHELRNPLSAMVHCADEIVSALSKFLVSRADGLVEDAIKATDTIIYCAMHQKRIVDDILTLSRLDSDLLVISPQPAVLSKTIRQAMKMFEPELKRAAISFILYEDKSLLGEDAWMLFDAGRVLQIFVNLMTNAIKFTRTEETRHIRVEIGASPVKPIAVDQNIKYVPKRATLRDQTGDAVWRTGELVFLSISVEDTGRGLTQDEMDRLFNVFQQASPKTHIQYGGSGLGLFISRQLVEMQGGEIGVTSTAGKGSTFSCYVKARRIEAPVNPCQLMEAPPSFMDVEALREASGGGIPNHIVRNDAVGDLGARDHALDFHSWSSRAGERLHVLVVEDNLINQKVVAKQLQRHDCIVSVANHGLEALSFIRRSEHWVGFSNGERLSVILMDLEMPIMDGLTCVKKIRQAQSQGQVRGHIPVIATTANARVDQVEEAMDAGMDNVIIKPYRIPDIISQVKSLLARLHNLTDVN